MFSNKILYKVAILFTLLVTFGILSNGGNLVQAQTPPPGTTPPVGPPPSPPGVGAAAAPPGGIGTITTATTTIPSNVTALNVYDNSTMVLEFGNGTTLASPYSNVWSISFLPAGNQTIGNIPPGGGVMPPGGAMTPGVGTTPPPAGGATPPADEDEGGNGGGGDDDEVECDEDTENPVDTDGDGIIDTCEPIDEEVVIDEVECDEDTENPVDTDGDGIIDTCEPI
jgi:hypothetical protein